jgi:hypothetical protein
MEVVKENGKVVEVDCDYFADESLSLDVAKELCFTDKGIPKCPVYHECWKVYTRRGD